eukprot:5297084-Pyramimonas_sp.AAC.1
MAFPDDVNGSIRWVQANRAAPSAPQAPLVSAAARQHLGRLSSPSHRSLTASARRDWRKDKWPQTCGPP